MKKLINEIKKHITENNKYLAEDLINEIIKKSINNIEELITLENNHFKIENKILNREEKIEYCSNNILNSYYDADTLDFEESQTYYKYYDLLKSSSNIEDKIKYIILLYELTNKKQLLIYELYNCIIENKI
ncbi:MAG: hypothetical protein ACI4XM_00175 [Candidatus Coprovivens sp.]